MTGEVDRRAFLGVAGSAATAVGVPGRGHPAGSTRGRRTADAAGDGATTGRPALQDGTTGPWPTDGADAGNTGAPDTFGSRESTVEGGVVALDRAGGDIRWTAGTPGGGRRPATVVDGTVLVPHGEEMTAYELLNGELPHDPDATDSDTGPAAEAPGDAGAGRDTPATDDTEEGSG